MELSITLCIKLSFADRFCFKGKRRILGILLELKAYDEAVDFQTVQNEYQRKFGISLNSNVSVLYLYVC